MPRFYVEIWSAKDYIVDAPTAEEAKCLATEEFNLSSNIKTSVEEFGSWDWDEYAAGGFDDWQHLVAAGYTVEEPSDE